MLSGRPAVAAHALPSPAFPLTEYSNNDGKLALSVDSASTGASPVAGGTQLGAMVGIKHTF
nr:hypothetical protein [Cupriavidus yeoncheonensis]